MDSGEASGHATTSVLDEVAAGWAAQMGAENFPVALRVLPGDVRSRLAAVYAFARFVDDVGDRAPVRADERLALLDVVEQGREVLGRGGLAGPAHVRAG